MIISGIIGDGVGNCYGFFVVFSSSRRGMRFVLIEFGMYVDMYAKIVNFRNFI